MYQPSKPVRGMWLTPSPQPTSHLSSTSDESKNESFLGKRVSSSDDGQPVGPSGKHLNSNAHADSTQGEGRKTSLMDIPAEIVCMIGRHLEPRDRDSMKISCRYLNEILLRDEIPAQVEQYYTGDDSIQQAYRKAAAPLFDKNNKIIVEWLKRLSCSDELKDWIKTDPLHMAALFRTLSNKKLSSESPGKAKPASVLEGHTKYEAIALLKSGQLVAYSLVLEVWKSVPGEDYKCVDTLEGHTLAVNSVIELADGRLVSSSWDSTLRVWVSASGEGYKCVDTLEGHTGGVLAVIELTNGRLVSCSFDGSMRIWESVPRGSFKCIDKLQGHTGGVIKAIELADERLLSCGLDKLLNVWVSAPGEGYKCVGTLEGHTRYVVSVIELTNGRLVSCSWDKTLKVWGKCDSGEGYKCMDTLEGHTTIVESVIELMDGRFLSGSYDRTLKVWAASGGGYKCAGTLAGHTSHVKAVIELMDGRLLSASRDRTLKVWDASGGGYKCVGTLVGQTGHITGDPKPLQLPDGRIVSCAGDKKLNLYELVSDFYSAPPSHQ